MKRLVTLAIALSSVVAGSAQELWTSAYGEYAITKRLKAGVGIECRTSDGLSGVGRWSVGAELDYKLCKYLKAEVAYRFIYDHSGDEYDDDEYIPSYWQPRQRVQVSLTGSYKVDRFTFSLREGYQYTYHRERTTVPSYDALNNEWTFDKVVNSKHKGYLRSRLEVEYNIRKSPFTPFVSCELYNNVSGFALAKSRYTVGTDYKINKRNAVQLFYRYVDKRSGADSNVIGVGYSYKFK